MTSSRYSSSIIILHWITFILVLIAAALGLYREYVLLPTNDPSHAAVMSLHMSVGIVVWALTILRLVARSRSVAPPPVWSPGVMAIAERGVHFLLYFSLIAVPLIGLASAWIRGRPFVFFGMFTIPSPLVTDWKSPTGKLLEIVHLNAAYAFLALAGLHVLAALYHQVIRHEQVIKRILPGAQQS